MTPIKDQLWLVFVLAICYCRVNYPAHAYACARGKVIGCVVVVVVSTKIAISRDVGV